MKTQSKSQYFEEKVMLLFSGKYIQFSLDKMKTSKIRHDILFSNKSVKWPHLNACIPIIRQPIRFQITAMLRVEPLYDMHSRQMNQKTYRRFSTIYIYD